MSKLNEKELDVRFSANIKINLGDWIEYANDYMLDLLEYNVDKFLIQDPKRVCYFMPNIICEIFTSSIL